MPWFVTGYNPSGGAVDTSGNTRGNYAGDLFANNVAHARRLARRRNIGEEVLGATTRRDRKLPYVLPSEWASKRNSAKNDQRTFHAMCWMAHLALKSGAATADELFGDLGVVHEWVHMRVGGRVRRAPLIARLQEIERRIPGFMPPVQARKRTNLKGATP